MDETRRGLLAALPATRFVGSASAGDRGRGRTERAADLRADGGRTAVTLVVEGRVTDPEAVILPAGIREALAVEPGDQIRVVADAEYAAYTVRAASDDGRQSAARVSSEGADRVRSREGRVEAVLDARVVKSDLSREEARARGEYTEGIVAGTDRLVACAPHGGFVEPGTGEQARQVADATGATAWYTAGYRNGGGAYDRWHVTSTDMSRASYPGLDDVADRGFDRAVAFHGWSERGIGIGGLAPESERVRLRDRIARETPLDVSLVQNGEYAGRSESNVVNRVTADGRSGLQLEQSSDAREEFGGTIARIVADLFG